MLGLDQLAVWLMGLVPHGQTVLPLLGALFVVVDVVIYPLLGAEAQTKYDLLKRLPVVGSVVEALEGFSKIGKKV